MANENINTSGSAPNNVNGSENGNNGTGNRRPSFTAQTFSAIFGRQNSVNHGTPATPAPAPTPSLQHQPSSSSSRPARRMSITTLGLNPASTSPISSSAPYFPSTAPYPSTAAGSAGGRDRRASVSTNSQDSAIDESAIEDDDAVPTHPQAQSVPTTPFARRMSIGAGAMFGRGGASPGMNPASHTVTSGSVSGPGGSSGGGSGGSGLPAIPARREAHHESAPRNSSFSVPKQRTGSLSKPTIGPSGLSQGLQQARRTSLSSLAQSGDVAGRSKATTGAATPQRRRTSVSSSHTITPTVNFTGGPASVGNISSSLGRSASGRKPRTLSDINHVGSSGASGLDWSEQFRSRAESTATRPHRPSFGASYTATAVANTSPNAEARPMAIGGQGQGGVMGHQRAASVSDMSEPPKEMPMVKREEKKVGSWLGGGGRKPDEVGERILRGEFLMD